MDIGASPDQLLQYDPGHYQTFDFVAGEDDRVDPTVHIRIGQVLLKVWLDPEVANVYLTIFLGPKEGRTGKLLSQIVVSQDEGVICNDMY
jgi:hypothetical protein